VTTTVGVIIDEIRALLRSWTGEEQSSTLGGSGLNSSATSFTLTDVAGVALNATPGILEIGSELIYASVIDASGNVTVPAWGRGYLNTTKTTHTAGARVISQPLFPRQKILDKLNDALERMFPDVFAVKNFNATTTLPQITYNLPDDAMTVLDAEWQVPDGTLRWVKVRRWEVNPGGRPTSAAGNNPDLGVTVDVFDGMMPGRPIHFIYGAKPSELTSESDVFETVTGLGASLKDVAIYAAASALVIPLEAARLQLTSAEQQDRTQKIAPSAALTTSRFLEQQFQVRLAEERKALTKLYKPRIHGGY
jgi:hypothetical protein